MTTSEYIAQQLREMSAGMEAIRLKLISRRTEIGKLTEQRDALNAAVTSFVDAFGAGEFDDPFKVVPYIARFREAMVEQQQPEDEPDRAGYPDMDSAGGDDSMDRAYGMK